MLSIIIPIKNEEQIINSTLEKTMIPNAEKVSKKITDILDYLH